jgi:molybdate transport system ATP-binding protein
MEKTLIDLHLLKDIHTITGNLTLDVQFSIPEFEFITLFGKSGVGKTTILRMIAGLTRPGSGYIKVGNESWFDNKNKLNLKTQKRNIGFVFQDYALFPNMTVEQHLFYAQTTKDSAHVNDLLEIFDLNGLRDRKPDILSGGQKQRVAVARALARKPQILLLDEPLSALDSEARLILQKEIMEAHKSFHSTTILVSHDVDEITRLSDQVYVIDSGRIVNSGNAEYIFKDQEPGVNYSIPCKVTGINGTSLEIELNGTVITIPQNEGIHKIGDTVNISIKSNGIILIHSL